MEIIEVDPRKVLYSQCCVRPTFKDGTLVENTIMGLVTGELSPSNIQLIRVCILPSGKMHSLDNRRLYAFKEAIKRGSNFRTVLAIRSFEFDSLKWKMEHPPSKDWSVVKVKFDCKPIFHNNILVGFNDSNDSRPYNNRPYNNRPYISDNYNYVEDANIQLIQTTSKDPPSKDTSKDSWWCMIS